MLLRPTIALAALAAALAGVSAAAAAPPVDQGSFRYARSLSHTGRGPAVFEPDARLYAHTQPGFADLRVVTPDGSQVPWRLRPEEEMQEPTPVALVYSGRRGGRAVALLDTGPLRQHIDRIALDLPDQTFVGRAEVLGSDDRKEFVKLSTTVIYDIAGATTARSTTAVFPPADFRYYLVRAAGVSSVSGGTIGPRTTAAPALVERPLQTTRVFQKRRSTVLVADLGFRGVPVDVLRVATTTPVFDRAVQVDGSNNRRTWSPIAIARVSRLPDSVTQPLEIVAHQRYLRVTITNGDDAPLRGLRLTALAGSRAILVRSDGPDRLRILYGNPRAAAPEYDYALLPVSALRLDEAARARLGPELGNPLSIPPAPPAPPTRSIPDRYPWLVGALLAVAALVIGAGGLAAALRPRPPGADGQHGGAATP